MTNRESATPAACSDWPPLIESYAGVFHTVDHVHGTIREGFDGLDAFLTHMWSVTMIGAPKKAAANAVEALEKRRAAGMAPIA